MAGFEGFFTMVMDTVRAPDCWPNEEYQIRKANEFVGDIVVALSANQGSLSSGELRRRDIAAVPNEPGHVAAVRINLAFVRHLPPIQRLRCTNSLLSTWSRIMAEAMVELERVRAAAQRALVANWLENCGEYNLNASSPYIPTDTRRRFGNHSARGRRQWRVVDTKPTEPNKLAEQRNIN